MAKEKAQRNLTKLPPEAERFIGLYVAIEGDEQYVLYMAARRG